MAATAGIIAISLAGDTEPAVALLPAAIGGIYLAGAIKGNKAVNECLEATSQYEQTTAARETQPARPSVPPEYDETSDIAARSPIAPPQQAAPGYPPAQQAAPIPSPTAAASRTMQPAAQAPVAQPPAAQPPVAQPPVQAPPVQQQPPPQPPAAKPAKPAKPAPPPPSDDDWSSFWREVE